MKYFSKIFFLLIFSIFYISVSAGTSNYPCQDNIKRSPIKGDYSKDTNGGVYYRCQKIADADTKTFQVSFDITCTEGIDDCYKLARDKNHVYIFGEVKPGLDPTFRYITKSGLAADKNFLYCWNGKFPFNGSKKIIKHLQLDGSGYIKNNSEIFILYDYWLDCEPLVGVDVKSFSYNSKQKIYTDKNGITGTYNPRKNQYSFKRKTNTLDSNSGSTKIN